MRPERFVRAAERIGQSHRAAERIGQSQPALDGRRNYRRGRQQPIGAFPQKENEGGKRCRCWVGRGCQERRFDFKQLLIGKKHC